MKPTDLLAHLQGELTPITAMLHTLVAHESPSGDKAAVDKLGTFLADQYRSLGLAVEELTRPNCGNHLRVSFGSGEQQVLVLAHMDTVWPVGSLANNPFRVDGDRAYGPGVNDDKGGLLIALWAVRTMVRLGLSPRKRVVILHNADEEVGSRDSRTLIEAEAAQSSHALILEVSTDAGAVKTARRGGFTFTLTAKGRAAHAGNDLANGINAIEELAHHVLELQRLTDHERGIALNVGAIQGGTKPAMVPDEAALSAYVRAWSHQDFAYVQTRVRELTPHLPGAQLAVDWGPIRPPFVRTPAVAALYDTARALAQEMGFPLAEGAAGAGSDGNLTAAVGTPTLDGLGPVGMGSHAAHEYVELTKLPERIALLIRLLQTL